MFFSRIVQLCQLHLGRLTWPGLVVLFVMHYCVCYFALRMAGETQITATLGDFIYYGSVVGSTLGFGDLSPQSQAGRWFTGLWHIPVSVALFGALMGKVIAVAQRALTKGIRGLSSFNHLQDHLIIVGWRGQQTEKMISLLLYDRSKTFNHILICDSGEVQHHPMPGHDKVFFARISNVNAPEEQQRIGLEHCHSVIIFAQNDEQTFTVALSIANKVKPSSHIVAYMEDERYATLLEQHCHDIEIVRNLSAEQLLRSVQDPGSSQSVASIMNPMLGDTGYVVQIPLHVTEFCYGGLMRYMKQFHDATVLGISHCKNGRGMELNPVVSTPVRGGMWLHLIGNQRITADEVQWHNIGNVL
ncbi:two pore domain potassium channel family protein [Atlantibacter hermannii]|uniref:potassium channel family protein n=1 Tax=Atlantibacter hermannii TaxID=565 RepID=UPI001C704C6B|nr:ion channel [Atlantibacter hermannii]MBW9429864.1 two pore domain potassium channel family protein [Atlantibacter hermannii]